MLAPQAMAFLTYGPAAAAMVTVAPSAASLNIAGTARCVGPLSGSASMPRAKATRLVNRPVVAQGAGSMAKALPKAQVRLASVIKVNALSQDDVTGALLEAPVEMGLSVKQTLRLLLAYLAGGATGLDGSTIAYRSLDDSKVRLGGTVTGGTRTITTRDGA